jgi:hypothetical protein
MMGFGWATFGKHVKSAVEVAEKLEMSVIVELYSMQ